MDRPVDREKRETRAMKELRKQIDELDAKRVNIVEELGKLKIAAHPLKVGMIAKDRNGRIAQVREVSFSFGTWSGGEIVMYGGLLKKDGTPGMDRRLYHWDQWKKEPGK